MAIDSLITRLKYARRQLPCMVALLPVFTAIYYLAYWLRFDGELDRQQLTLFSSTVGWVVLTKLLLFGWFRIYQGWGRYVTFHDLVLIVQAAILSSLLMALSDYLLLPSWTIPRSVFLMDWGATVVVVGGLRALMRLLQDGQFFLVSTGKVPAFIVGANDSGEALLRAISRNRRTPYNVVGFIDEHPRRVGSCIGGVPVVGTLEQTCRLAKRYGVGDVLITAGELTGRQVRRLVEQCRRDKVRVKVLPSYEQLLNGTVAIDPRPVSIEDLLGREPVRLDMASLRHWIDDRVLIVTGSAGSIGSEICRQLLQFAPRRLVLIDRSENGQFFIERELRALMPNIELEVCIADVADQPRMRTLFLRYRPDIIFHAAAYKHVPLMEANAGEAVKNIALATHRLADLANDYGVWSFVMISTDKAVSPTSVMGACKRVAELYVQSLSSRSSCRFVSVRFGNVLDSAGSVVQIFREQIRRGGPVTVTDHRMQRYFMTIPEASQLVIQAGAMGQGGECFVLDMGEPVRIVDLATDMIRLSGLQLGDDIEIEFNGLRPGEKLYEELHAAGEKHTATRHPKIMVAQRDRYDMSTIRAALDRLETVSEQPVEVIVAELQRIVPEYRATDATVHSGTAEPAVAPETKSYKREAA